MLLSMLIGICAVIMFICIVNIAAFGNSVLASLGATICSAICLIGFIAIVRRDKKSGDDEEEL